MKRGRDHIAYATTVLAEYEPDKVRFVTITVLLKFLIALDKGLTSIAPLSYCRSHKFDGHNEKAVDTGKARSEREDGKLQLVYASQKRTLQFIPE